MYSDLVCSECGSTDISVECVVRQVDGNLKVQAVCDDGHSCNVCDGERITERLSQDTALKEIQLLLDKTEWSAETPERVAEIVRRTGRPVREPMVDEPEEGVLSGEEPSIIGDSINASGPTYGAAPGGA